MQRVPSVRRPSAWASAIANGIVPAVVLATRSMLITTFSSGNDSRLAVGSMIRPDGWPGAGSADQRRRQIDPGHRAGRWQLQPCDELHAGRPRVHPV